MEEKQSYVMLYACIIRQRLWRRERAACARVTLIYDTRLLRFIRGPLFGGIPRYIRETDHAFAYFHRNINTGEFSRGKSGRIRSYMYIMMYNYYISYRYWGG